MSRIAAAIRFAAFALFVPLVAVVAYYGPAFRHGRDRLPHHGDAHFYIYQLARAAEERGAFWRSADDPLFGRPYPSMAAKHPGLYEGIDLAIFAAVTGPDFDPVVRYHLAMAAVLALNGYLAAFLVKRLGGSDLAAVVAVVLIITNHSTAGRLNGHLHLFKHFYSLLATSALARVLSRPTGKSGLALGLAVASAVQGSYYLGFFVAVAVAVVWLVRWAVGRIDARHWLAAAVAAAVSVPLVAAATAPVWGQTRRVEHSGQFYQRDRRDTWEHGSELWMYVVPPDTDFGRELLTGAGRDGADLLHLLKGTPSDDRSLRRQVARTGRSWEGWHFPGVTIWLGVIGYAVWRSRGRDFGPATAWIDTAMSLSAVWVLLSLAGGPSALLVGWVPGIRCYGRAGLVAVGVLAVAAPLVLDHLRRPVSSRSLRRALAAALVAAAIGDAAHGRRAFHNTPPEPDPPWCDWLREQPPGVRFAALDPADPDRWNWRALYLRCRHRQPALNGCEPAAYRDPITEAWLPAAERVERLERVGFDTFAWPSGSAELPAGHEPITERANWVIFRRKIDPAPR